MTSSFARSYLVRQAESGECGLACLAMVARYFGDSGDLPYLRRRFRVSSRGTSLWDLVRISEQMGLTSRGVKADMSSIGQVRLPAILHWNMNHFVVLTKIRGTAKRRFVVLDPARGEAVLSEDEISKSYTGVCLEVTPSVSFSPSRHTERLKIGQLWSKMSGLWAGLAKILLLAVIVQAIALVVPLLMQISVDSVLPAMDADLLAILAFGFAALVSVNAFLGAARSRLTLGLGHDLNYQATVNLFKHALFLPISWYERRHLGDVISRFESLQPVSDLVSRALVDALVDAVMVVACLALMFVYSPKLAAVAISAVFIYALMKLAFFGAMKNANANVIAAQAEERSAFIENVRGASSIKAFCQETARQEHWQNKRAAYARSSYILSKISSDFNSMNSFVVAIEGVVFIYLAIRMVMDGRLSLGMVFAFQSYKMSFVGAAVRLIEQLASYKLLDVHLGRLSDIALERRESNRFISDALPIRCIELKDVGFTYGEGLPPVIEGVSIKIDATKVTAICGSSGSGKTTLIKIISGLVMPTSGVVLVDGVPLHDYGVRTYRNNFGFVSQEDVLFAGTIARNVSFFDNDCDYERVVKCCRIADVHAEIMDMPMKYETFVSDMGVSLSGGQKQRVLLARALYKSPNIVLLDEGTAHLDGDSESVIIERLRNRSGGLILVTHRESLLSKVDDVYRVQDRRVFISDSEKSVTL